MAHRSIRRALCTVAWLVVALLAGCIGGPTEASAAPFGELPRVDTPLAGHMRGVVTSAADGVGLQRVRLVLRRAGTREVVNVSHTERGGRFDFEALRSGVYSIEARAAGYLPAILAPLVVRPGKEARVEHITLTLEGGGRAS